MCGVWANASSPYLGLVNLTLTFQSGACMDNSYSDYIASMQNTSDARSWTYQTCREFGYYQTTDCNSGCTPPQPFPTYLPLNFSLQQCQDIFGEPFVPDVDWTNAEFGARNIISDNTFMTNGDVDPWSVLGTFDTCMNRVFLCRQTDLIVTGVHPPEYGPGPTFGPGTGTFYIKEPLIAPICTLPVTLIHRC